MASLSAWACLVPNRLCDRGGEATSDLGPELFDAVSEYTNVPRFMLYGGTAAVVWQSAREAVDWKQATAPPAPPATSADSASSQPSGPITPKQIVNGSGDWMDAYRSGRLAPAGIPAPPLRRTGKPKGRNL